MKWLQRIASVEMLRQIVYMQRLCKLTSEIMKIGEEFLKKAAAFHSRLPYADCPGLICDLLNIGDGLRTFLSKLEKAEQFCR